MGKVVQAPVSGGTRQENEYPAHGYGRRLERAHEPSLLRARELPDAVHEAVLGVLREQLP